MKKIALFFALLVLAGAGCTTTTSMTKEQKNPEPKIEIETAVGTTTEIKATEPAEVEPAEASLNQPTDEPQVESTPAVQEPIAVSEQTIDMSSDNFLFAPNALTASPGQKITIHIIKNSGFHTFVIDEIGLKFSTEEGKSFSFNAPTEPGEYAFYCDVGSHRAMGMEGVLMVR